MDVISPKIVAVFCGGFACCARTMSFAGITALLTMFRFLMNPVKLGQNEIHQGRIHRGISFIFMLFSY